MFCEIRFVFVSVFLSGLKHQQQPYSWHTSRCGRDKSIHSSHKMIGLSQIIFYCQSENKTRSTRKEKMTASFPQGKEQDNKCINSSIIFPASWCHVISSSMILLWDSKKDGLRIIWREDWQLDWDHRTWVSRVQLRQTKQVKCTKCMHKEFVGFSLTYKQWTVEPSKWQNSKQLHERQLRFFDNRQYWRLKRRY